MFSFMGRLHELTRDPAFLQVLYHANDRAVAGLPHDVFAADPAGFQTRVAQGIAEHGDVPKHESVNKQQWRIGLLKSGAGADSRGGVAQLRGRWRPRPSGRHEPGPLRVRDST